MQSHRELNHHKASKSEKVHRNIPAEKSRKDKASSGKHSQHMGQTQVPKRYRRRCLEGLALPPDMAHASHMPNGNLS